LRDEAEAFVELKVASVIAASCRPVKMWAGWGAAMGLFLGRFCAEGTCGRRIF